MKLPRIPGIDVEAIVDEATAKAMGPLNDRLDTVIELLRELIEQGNR